MGIGASLSQGIAGSIAHHLGSHAGFLFLAAVAAAALGIVGIFMPETGTPRAGAGAGAAGVGSPPGASTPGAGG